MGRSLRTAEGGLVYHALNRGNARLAVFDDDGDYDAFLRVLGQAVAGCDMRLLAYCLMPNHFHLLLRPHGDGDLSRFMRWLTLTHTQRWHAHRRSAGAGHLDQGRFKSFPIETDDHSLTACRYVERNALRAGLVDRAEDWRWGSLSPGAAAPPAAAGPPLSPWPVARPPDWTARVNAPLTAVEEEALLQGVRGGRPYGSATWQSGTAS